MALLLRPLLVVSVFVLAASWMQLSSCKALKARVSCLDCSTNYDLSGVKVLIKCDQMKETATTFTNSKGNFEVEIPIGSSNCLAKLLGGQVQLYASRGKMVSKIVQDPSSSSSYSTSTPLAFSTKCPLESGKSKYYCNNGKNVGSSKTVNFPLPREWGLAPSSYYIPFFPIIGIP